MAMMNRCKSANGTKLQGAVDVQRGHAAIQRDFNKLKKWANKDLLELRKGKCQILGTERNNSMCQYRLGNTGKAAWREKTGASW